MLDWNQAKQQTDAEHVIFLHAGGAEKKSLRKLEESPMSSDIIYFIIYDYDV